MKWALVLVTGAALHAQTSPTAAEIVKRVEATYKGITEWDAELHLQVTPDFVRHLHSQGHGEKLLRFETQGVMTLVSDGQNMPANGTEAVTETWWVDKQRNLVLRMGDAAPSASNFVWHKVNQPVPDETFRFVPPAGAKEAPAR